MVNYYHFTWLQLPFLEQSKHTKHILQSFTQYACIESTELNDLRLIICLRKSEVIAKRISVCIVILNIDGACSCTNDVMDLLP